MPRKFEIPSVKKFFFPIIVALFVLATVNIAYDLVGEGYAILYTIPVTGEKTWMIAGQIPWRSIDTITFAISDILGDTVLFYRVYAVWGFRKRILIPLLLIISVAKVFNILETIWSISGPIDIQSPLTKFFDKAPNFDLGFSAINAFANMLMTLLIAGRIWWISKAVEIGYTSGMKPRSKWHWYHRTVAIITESGVIYPIYLIVGACSGTPNYACLGTITVGLAPTLIAVQVGLGSAYDNPSLHSMRPSFILFSPPNESQMSPVYVNNGVFQLVSSRHATNEAADNTAKFDSNFSHYSLIPVSTPAPATTMPSLPAGGPSAIYYPRGPISNA
ncbi:hypothetical protein GYMLUDRAFT_265549 [Collybiopsis luxurians FD-317 M1]|uniref:Uncharacterized protein n=1 Tax=Collybiopsis luxurians FD-317 M1 TaxID=944289 RepID=A0A0D0BR50_9AGAR|nr:hypothetical protein GYMLUDRAFT_265549 [Collybiopsis luxurians FD-317 M1]